MLNTTDPGRKRIFLNFCMKDVKKEQKEKKLSRKGVAQMCQQPNF